MQGLRDPQGAHAGVPGARRLASRACRARPWRSSPARTGAQPPARQAVRLGVHADSTLQQPAPAAAPSSPSAAGLDNKCTIKVRGLPDQLLLGGWWQEAPYPHAGHAGGDAGVARLPIQAWSPSPTFSHCPAPAQVVGVGGGGSNAVNRMLQSELQGVDLWVLNTDAQARAWLLVGARFECTVAAQLWEV